MSGFLEKCSELILGSVSLQKMVAEYIYEDEGFRKEKERQIVEEGR